LNVLFEELVSYGKSIKNKLNVCFTSYWKIMMDKSRDNGKLRTYCYIKVNFGFENYLYKIKKYKES